MSEEKKENIGEEIKDALIDLADDSAIKLIKTLEAPVLVYLTAKAANPNTGGFLKVICVSGATLLPIIVGEGIKYLDKIDGKVEHDEA